MGEVNDCWYDFSEFAEFENLNEVVLQSGLTGSDYWIRTSELQRIFLFFSFV